MLTSLCWKYSGTFNLCKLYQTFSLFILSYTFSKYVSTINISLPHSQCFSVKCLVSWIFPKMNVASHCTECFFYNFLSLAKILSLFLTVTEKCYFPVIMTFSCLLSCILVLSLQFSNKFGISSYCQIFLMIYCIPIGPTASIMYTVNS
jgi:hypothetical protein